MKFEAVIVCINYHDFLRETLPTNKSFFEKVVVVTDEQDVETARVCEFNNVMCIKTNDFYDNGDLTLPPNKAKGINAGLKALDKDGWVLHLDADIYLPPLTRHLLDRMKLDEKCLYGIDRMMCNSYEDWFKFKALSKPIHEGWIYLHLNHFEIGQRLVQYHGDGYLPIGFFQLWNPKGSGVYTYPVEQAGFDRTDVMHIKQFHKHNRKFLPELVCVHLASESHKQGQSWKGRKTREFKPRNFLEIGLYTLIRMFKDTICCIKNLFVCPCPRCGEVCPPDNCDDSYKECAK